MNKKESEDNIISKHIRHYGVDVLNSEVFQEACDEKHHLYSSVADHTLNVCITSTQISLFLRKLGVRINEKDLIQASLCHDLGMVGRNEKYENQKDTWKNHADESAKIAHELIPELSSSAEELIRSHMWPAGGSIPRTREGLILTFADKYASTVDWIALIFGRKYMKKTKKKIMK